MLLIGQEGLVSHLPGLICKKKKKKLIFFFFFFFFFFFCFYLAGGNSFVFILKGERCVDM